MSVETRYKETAMKSLLAQLSLRHSYSSYRLHGIVTFENDGQVTSVYWDGVINQKSNRRKYLVEADTIWATLEDEGVVLHRDEPPSQKVSCLSLSLSRLHDLQEFNSWHFFLPRGHNQTLSLPLLLFPSAAAHT